MTFKKQFYEYFGTIFSNNILGKIQQKNRLDLYFCEFNLFPEYVKESIERLDTCVDDRSL